MSERVSPSFPMHFDSKGTPFYICVGCGRPTRVADVMSKRAFFKNGRIETSHRTTSRIVGFEQLGFEFSKDLRGFPQAQAKFRPKFISGPSCALCAGKVVR